MSNQDSSHSPNETTQQNQQDSGQSVRQVADQTMQATQSAGQMASTISQITHDPNTALSSALQATGQVEGITRTLAGTSSVVRDVSNTIGQATQYAQQAISIAQQVQSFAQNTGGNDSGLSSAPLAHVQYRFTPESGETNWRVVGVKITQEISEPYEMIIDLANEDLDAEFLALRHHNASLSLRRNEHEHTLHGWVDRVTDLGHQAGHQLCRVWVVPALSMLKQRVNCRVFQNKTVTDIVEDVWGTGLKGYGRLIDYQAGQEALPREYCIQYNESDFHFIQRLLAEEGVNYYFTHNGDHETLVLVESVQAFQRAHLMDDAPVEIIGPEARTAERESVRSFHWTEETQVNRVVTRDYDYTQPDLDLTHDNGERSGSNVREQFVYPANLTYAGYEAHHYTDHTGSVFTAIRQQSHTQNTRTAVGEGNVIGFVAGGIFSLHGHAHNTRNGRYLITKVVHHGSAMEELTSDTHSEQNAHERYGNEFTVVPAEVEVRPQRLPKPSIAGHLTAVVTGPANEEIHTDYYGRIKVQFHWDRDGQKNERSSCYLRVMQPWAGVGWGFVFVPRIGMEVVVSFEQGNPDRPLVVGTVYNGTHPLPLELPEKRTRSTIRTSSTPGGQGFNEIAFDDEHGNEEIFVHAQKNYNEVVEHNHNTTVHASQTNNVDIDQSETVGANQTMTVKGNRTKTVHGEERINVQQSRTARITMDDNLRTNGSQYIVVDQKQQVMVSGDRLLRVAGDSTQLAMKNKMETISQNHVVKIGGNETVEVRGNHTTTVNHHAVLNGVQVIQLNQGPTRLEFSDGNIEWNVGGTVRVASGEARVEITANHHVTVHSPSTVQLTNGQSSVTVVGSSVQISGMQQIFLSAGGSSISIDQSGVCINGSRIAINGQGDVSVGGSMVKVN